MTTYNGWKNKQTWLVGVWYFDYLPHYFADVDQYHVEADELKDAVIYMAEETEALSQLPKGLLSDFINTCWGSVDWQSLADTLNETLKEMDEE